MKSSTENFSLILLYVLCRWREEKVQFMSLSNCFQCGYCTREQIQMLTPSSLIFRMLSHSHFTVEDNSLSQSLKPHFTLLSSFLTRVLILILAVVAVFVVTYFAFSPSYQHKKWLQNEAAKCASKTNWKYVLKMVMAVQCLLKIKWGEEWLYRKLYHVAEGTLDLKSCDSYCTTADLILRNAKCVVGSERGAAWSSGVEDIGWF